ncbi:hypothetical protein B0H16DRAFT_1502937 [Mycena metata]|uniref:Uncharacterized protein n=1 Tax=Mycena metata TaxID=1033252 RepID=A0AAD7K7A9_9AGAR|nr:hypothetical protein B0H16DRAFT_1502937 [Mycena metata]
MVRWTAPPTRREISLLIFSLTVFALAYNVDSSVRLQQLQRSLGRLGMVGVGGGAIGKEGKRVAAARDALEDAIYGPWRWNAGEIAGDGEERRQAKGVGRHGAMWVERREVEESALVSKGSVEASKGWGQPTVEEAFWRWGEDVPLTSLVKHVPGYTVIDNIILFNGTMNIVTEDPNAFPSTPQMIFSTGLNQWQFLSPQKAREQLGPFGGRIRGVTWMSADSAPHNSTLLALWRIYSALDPDISAAGATTLAPPRRLLYPYYGFFTDRNPEHADVTTRRQRVVNGIHPELVKAAFPFTTVMYYADWEDYHAMEVPFVVERLVVADRTAAREGVQSNEPIYAAPFNKLEGSPHWWEPVRRTLAAYFDVYGEKAPKEKTITYVHRQSQTHGLRLSEADHLALVGALQKLERDHGYEVHVVSNVDEEMSWSERLGAIVRSSVMLGVHDSDLLDSVYMQRTPHTTLMEFFPPQTFAREQELVAHSVGIRYVAWWNDRQLSGDDLPPVARPNDGEAVPIDIPAIIRAVKQTLH